jgi:hypothetical protein
MKVLLSMLLAVWPMSLPQQPREGRVPRHWSIELYDAARYKGQAKTYKSATPDVAASGSRRVKSAIVVGNWEICDKPGFNGNCRTLRSSIADLHVWGFTGQVRSVRPIVPAVPRSGR